MSDEFRWRHVITCGKCSRVDKSTHYANGLGEPMRRCKYYSTDEKPFYVYPGTECCPEFLADAW